MKFRTYVLVGFMNLVLACSHIREKEIQNDHIEGATVQIDSTSGGNLIKSEAPDTLVHITQGYALPRFDDKRGQSPVNILTDSTVSDLHESLVLKFNIKISAIENLGHTIQLDFNDGSTTLAGGKVYISKQFHFHTPSEHLIDGMTFPMEMHIVNILNDSTKSKNPQYLVIALLFKMGQENKFLKEFLNAIPPVEGKDTLSAGTVNFEDLFGIIPKNEQGYFSYKGSLTTPPFVESVDWIVKKFILEASPEQIYKIEKMEGDNARHVQSLNSRKISSI